MPANVEAESTLALQYEDMDSLPILILNVHSRCNCRCVMCDIWKRTEHEEMSAHDVEKLVEDMRRLGVRWVVLTGGEPLMHSDLRSLCVVLRAEGIRITLLTTGLLLKTKAAEVCGLLDEVIVSIDGPAEVHDLIRGTAGGFRVIEQGIRTVRELFPHVLISARTTVQAGNHRYLCETVAVAHKLDLHSISFLAADVTSTAFNRELVWPLARQNTIALDAEQIVVLEQEVEKMIATCADDLRTGFVRESPEKLYRIVDHFRAHLGRITPTAPNCNAPWVSAVVEVNGTVRPCFFHKPIGTLSESSLHQVLNGPTSRQFRHELDIEKDEICQRCVCSLNYRS